MQIFKFWVLGAGGKFQFFLTKPYKECECHQNASFKLLTAIIGPVAMSMKLNKKAQLTLTNPRDAEACKNCSNSTRFVSFHRIPFRQISNYRFM